MRGTTIVFRAVFAPGASEVDRQSLSIAATEVIADFAAPTRWVDETWTVESTYRPSGLRLWIVFLVDPQHDGPRRKGEQVWAVGLSTKPPREVDEVRPVFQIRRHCKESLRALTAEVSRIRDEATRVGDAG